MAIKSSPEVVRDMKSTLQKNCNLYSRDPAECEGRNAFER